MELPIFKYHPQPLLTGHVQRSTTTCICCGQARGYIYVGPVYAAGDFRSLICPWCIADGTAHERLNVEFTDAASIGGMGHWDKVPEEVVAEVAFRTPGFTGWQQEQWFTHCGDAAAFIGRVGHRELETYGSVVIEIMQKASMVPDKDWPEYFQALDKDGSPTAYLFKCLHCGQYGGYTDCD